MIARSRSTSTSAVPHAVAAPEIAARQLPDADAE
jgi:hypothetical protein